MSKKYKEVMGLLITVLMLSMLFTAGIVSQAAERVSLLLWSGYPEMGPYYELAAEDYEKENPNIKINVSTYKLRDFERKLKLAVATGTGPDLFEAYNYIAQPFVESGALLPVSSQIENYLRGGKFYQVMIDDLTYKGKIYGVPIFQSTDGMFWNKSMFREAALPGPPESWGDIIFYAQKLAKYDAKGNLTRSGISLRLSGGGSGTAAKWWYFLRSAGGDLFEKTPSGKYHNGYDNVAGRDTLQFYIDLVYKYHVDDFKIKHDAEAFALGKTAMFIREPWVVGYMKQHAPDVEYDFYYFPKFRRWETLLYWNSLYVIKGTKFANVAWDFTRFLAKPKYDKFLIENVGWLPPRTTISSEYKELFEQIPQYKCAVAPFPQGYGLYPYPKLICTDEVLTKLAERLVAAFARKDLVDNPKGIAKVIADAAEETDDILKSAGLYGEK